jgi:anthranilate phosphoribosyltransferase
MIKEAIEILSGGTDLTAYEMEQVMQEIMSGKVETPVLVSFLVNLSKKGETPEELTAAVKIMHQFATKIDARDKIILDTCGTGGDRLGTFNISTVAAFVCCGAGVTVAKHGNRSVSSKSGSADILEALGINIHMSKEKIEKCLNEIGIAFLFAPNLHPAMKYAMPARSKIRNKTIFNLIGPLSNPAGATHQLVGVYDSHWLEPLAKALKNLGIVHSMVVCGEDGLDEITITAKTKVAEGLRDKIKSYEINPEDFGFKKAGLEDLAGGSAQDNAKILLDILNGLTGPKRDIVLLNAGSAIYVADKVNSIKEGIELARISIDSKKALERLQLLKEYSNK